MGGAVAAVAGRRREGAAQAAAEKPILIGRFEVDGRPIFGRLDDDSVELLSEAANADVFPDIAALRARPKGTGRTVAASELSWLPPIYGRHRVFAMALNYAPHAAETGSVPPESPLVFYKPPSAFVAPYGRLSPRPGYTGEYDYEGEIAVVIGRTCHNVTADEALSCVRGVIALMDGSARDRLRVAAGKRVFLDWIGSKAFDGGSLAGPAIACGEGVIEAIRARTLRLTTRLNDEIVQKGSIRDLIFPVEKIIAFLSGILPLYPGDVISTGTPGGVGQARGQFLKPGDRIAVDVTHVPTLVGTVAA